MTIVKTKDYVYCNCVTECRVIDGDSQELRLDLGYNLTVKTKTRVLGIDAPENNTEAGKLVTAVHWRWIKGSRWSGNQVNWKSTVVRWVICSLMESRGLHILLITGWHVNTTANPLGSRGRMMS